jgi:UBA-like domain
LNTCVWDCCASVQLDDSSPTATVVIVTGLRPAFSVFALSVAYLRKAARRLQRLALGVCLLQATTAKNGQPREANRPPQHFLIGEVCFRTRWPALPDSRVRWSERFARKVDSRDVPWAAQKHHPPHGYLSPKMDEDDYGTSPVAPDGDDDLFGAVLAKFDQATVADPDELVKQWSAIMSVPPDEARFFLESCNYDLGAAIGFYLEAHTREAPAKPVSSSSSSTAAAAPNPFSAFATNPFARGPTGAGLALPSGFGRTGGNGSAEADDDEDDDLQAALAESAKGASTTPAAALANSFPPAQLFSSAAPAFAGGFLAAPAPAPPGSGPTFGLPTTTAPPAVSGAPQPGPGATPSSSAAMDEL